jgi:hypothetical protein
MSTKTTNRDTATDMPTELAHRAGDGIEVLLLWNGGDGQLRVVVDDHRGGSSFELVAGDGKQALDAFYHPFAYAAARGIAYWTQAQSADGSVAAPPTASASSLR